jgi:hypothetical protein
MGPRFNGAWLGVFVALAFAVTTGYAKDPKRAGPRDGEAAAAATIAREARSVAAPERSTGREGATLERKPNGKPIAPLADQQVLRSNPFRFNIGAVAVQPTVGGIKGAQFSIGF